MNGLDITHRVFGSDTPLSSAGAVGAAVLVVCVAAGAAWLIRHMIRRHILRAAFVRAALARDFDEDDARSLWALARFMHNERKMEILASVECFEDCVRDASVAAGDDLLAWPEFLSESRINSLRRRFVVKRHTPTSISDTRQIEPNQPVTVHGPDGSRLAGFVMPSQDNNLRLTVPVKSESLTVDRSQSVRVTFARPQDARYEFSSRIVEEQRHALDLAHVAVKRIQERSQVRVRCQNEISLDRAGTSAGQTETAMLRDLSAGGACFVAESVFCAGERIVVHLKSRFSAEPMRLQARLIRQVPLKGTSRTMQQTSIRFDPLDPRHEYYLSRMVNDMQQNLIRRMLARAGEEESEPVIVRAPGDHRATSAPNAPIAASSPAANVEVASLSAIGSKQ